MPARDPSVQRLVDKVLGDSSLYPEELKAWVPKVIRGNPNLRLQTNQLPRAESTRRVGATGQPGFQGAWTNYGSGNEEAGFYRDVFDRVNLCGLVKNGAAGTTIFTLPGGFAPEGRQSFIVLTGPADQIGRIDVAANGDVIHVSGATGYVQLNGLSFRAF